MHAMTLIMKSHSYLVYHLENPSYKATPNYTIWFLITPTINYHPDLPFVPVPKNEFAYRIGERCLGIFVGWLITHMTIEHYVYPLALSSKQPLSILVELFFPSLIVCLVLFLTFFEFFLGLLGVLTGYGERNFYADWWNSTTFEQFARTWNLPVHNFIRHHVYEPFVLKLGLDRKRAMLYVFLLSSILHEAIVQVAFGKLVMPYLFLFQMLQLPFTWFIKRIAKLPIVGSPVILNMIFWFKMIVGPPVIFLFYARYHNIFSKSIN